MGKGNVCPVCGRTDGWTVKTKTELVNPDWSLFNADKWQYEIPVCNKCGHEGKEVPGTRKRIRG